MSEAGNAECEVRTGALHREGEQPVEEKFRKKPKTAENGGGEGADEFRHSVHV